MLTTLHKAKTTPVAGNKRKADDMTTDVAPPAPVAQGPPPFADGPSAAPPSALSKADWPGLPEPKRFPMRQHYDTELAFKRARLDFHVDEIKWCKREQARLSERIEIVTGLCRGDADSINTMKADIAKLEAQIAEEAAGASAEDFLQENLDEKREKSAAAANAEAEGVADATNITTITLPVYLANAIFLLIYPYPQVYDGRFTLFPLNGLVSNADSSLTVSFPKHGSRTDPRLQQHVCQQEPRTNVGTVKV
ncbi:hypothetical protein FCOIX_154 [Fusarium coicis]|nr:hypothetical protein FCOIX_154 [Fusarium coicis]